MTLPSFASKRSFVLIAFEGADGFDKAINLLYPAFARYRRFSNQRRCLYQLRQRQIAVAAAKSNRDFRPRHAKAEPCPICMCQGITSPPDYPGIWPSARHAGASGARAVERSAYAEYLEAMADPSHERHAEMLERCGPDFDPNAVDEAAIRKQLNRLTRAENPKSLQAVNPQLSADAYGGPISRISAINPPRLTSPSLRKVSFGANPAPPLSMAWSGVREIAVPAAPGLD